jgi:hypothetical protein
VRVGEFVRSNRRLECGDHAIQGVCWGRAGNLTFWEASAHQDEFIEHK